MIGMVFVVFMHKVNRKGGSELHSKHNLSLTLLILSMIVKYESRV